jgi:hypothetical protein
MVARLKSWDTFFCNDIEGDSHFYRLFKVVENDGSRAATYFHYCGTDANDASEFIPRLRPSEDMFKPLKRRK